MCDGWVVIRSINPQDPLQVLYYQNPILPTRLAIFRYNMTMLNIPQRKGRAVSDELQVGMTGESHTTVTNDLTAKKMGSGSLLVYSTPAMIALMEAAAVNAIEPYLAAGQTTVGIQIEVRHISASPVGEQVRAEAQVMAVEGKRVLFAVRAWDEQEMIGEGSHTRYLIDEEKFMERVQSNSRE